MTIRNIGRDRAATKSRVVRTRLVPAVVAALLLLTACSNSSGGSSKGDKSDVTVGIVQLDTANPFTNEQVKDLKVEFKKLGYKTVVGNAQGDPSKAIAVIQGFVQQKVDAIVTQAIDGDQLRTGLVAAERAKIPVFDAAGGPVAKGFAGSVNIYLEGLINELVVKAVADTGKPTKVFNARYQPGAPCRARAADLQSRLSGMKNVEITTQDVPIPGAAQKAQQGASAWLQANPKSDNTAMIIVACFADPALGAIAAEKQLKRGPYLAFTWDTTQPALDAIRAGTLTANGWLDPVSTAVSIKDMVARYLKDPGAWKPETAQGKTVVITKDNVDAFVKDHPEAGFK